MRRPPRSLILVTIDCLRADHVGFIGYAGNTTPFLDSLAEESFVFRNAVASGIPTYYSLPALVASRYPLALGRDVIGIAPDESTIASELRDCGFKTAAFVAANPYVSPAFGYANGFDVFCDFLNTQEVGASAEDEGKMRAAWRSSANRALSRTFHRLPVLGAAYDELYFQYCQTVSASEGESLDSLRKFPSADVIVDCAIAWLNQNANSPFFLWLHFMDPHAPYYPKPQAIQGKAGNLLASEAKYLNATWQRNDLGPERLQKKRPAVVDLYDAGIRWADAQIGRLTQRLVELSVWEQCALAVTADHGEEFLEHGGRFHSPLKLNRELVNVPLLLRVPGFAGRRDLESPLGLIDVTPTLLDALEVPPPASFGGRSCWPKLINNETWNFPVFTECIYGCSNPFDTGTREAARLLAIRKANYKLIVNFSTGVDELFHLESDPGELSPLPERVSIAARRELLDCGRRHLAESQRARNIDLRLGSQLRDFRLRCAQPLASGAN